MFLDSRVFFSHTIGRRGRAAIQHQENTWLALTARTGSKEPYLLSSAKLRGAEGTINNLVFIRTYVSPISQFENNHKKFVPRTIHPMVETTSRIRKICAGEIISKLVNFLVERAARQSQHSTSKIV